MTKKDRGGELLKQFGLYALLGALMYVIYFLLVFLCAGSVARQLNDELPEGAYIPIEMAFFVICALLYFLPIYLLLFTRNVSLKTEILRITSVENGGFSLKKVFAEVYRAQGIADNIVYAVYALLMLLPLGGIRHNPFVFISMQQSIFYALPILPIFSYLLAVIFFAAQYALCLLIVTQSWNKNRIRP